MAEKFNNTIEYINPAFENTERQKRFLEKYRQREIMAFGEGFLEYIDISPEKTSGKDIFVAVGTPSNWEQMEEFVFCLVDAGHRVTALKHPDLSLKASLKYDPKKQRPLAIQAFFKEKHLTDQTVIAHSFGLIDVVNSGPEGVGRLVAINPAGLNRNNPVLHSLNAVSGIKLAFSPGAGNEEEKAAYQKLVKDLFRQTPLKSFKEVVAAGKADLRKDLSENFSQIPIVIVQNDDDSFIKPGKTNKDLEGAGMSFKRLEGGGNHLGPFIHGDQADEIVKVIDGLERIEKNKEEQDRYIFK